MQDHRYGLYPTNELAGISPDSVLTVIKSSFIVSFVLEYFGLLGIDISSGAKPCNTR